MPEQAAPATPPYPRHWRHTQPPAGRTEIITMGYTPPITTGRGQALRAGYMAAGIFLGSIFTLVFAGMFGGGA